MLTPKITKEEVNTLPIAEFRGEIIIVDELLKIKPALEYLRQQKFVGLDTETKPSFQRGTTHKVSLIQISTLDKCFLFRLNKIGFPEELLRFLADEKIKKVGLSLRDDFNGLKKRSAIKPANFIDLQNIAKDYGILELSLQKIYAILFNRKISKSQRLSNWENPVLTEQQACYAATDAWACLQIYLHLIEKEKLTQKEIEKLISEVNSIQQ
ncbi:MAG: 3'-5' exonuclease [Bacteroidetes bacterium]|nr:3'-5' exonuclease [Bacteroidota bacterium]